MPAKKKKTKSSSSNSTWLDQRLKKMAAALKKATQGDFSKLRASKKKDEPAKLRAAINLAIDELKAAEKTEQELEEKTKELEEQQEPGGGEQRFRQLFNNLASGIAIYEVKVGGKEFYFKDFNPAAEKMEEKKKENVIGKEIREEFPGAEKMGIIKIFSQVYKTGKKQHFPPTKYEEDGNVAWRENFVYKLNESEIVAVFNDVTDQRESEVELAEKVEELEKFNRLMVDRELKMIELKETIKKLKQKNSND